MHSTHANYACILCMHNLHAYCSRPSCAREGAGHPVRREAWLFFLKLEVGRGRLQGQVSDCGPWENLIYVGLPRSAAARRRLPQSAAACPSRMRWSLHIYIYIYIGIGSCIYIYIYIYSFLGDTFIFHGGPGLAPATGERNWRRAPCNQVDARG